MEKVYQRKSEIGFESVSERLAI